MTTKANGSRAALRIDTQNQSRARKTWRQALSENAPLLLPVAHDALTARIIELTGYPAYQIGGFRPCRLPLRLSGHRSRAIW